MDIIRTLILVIMVGLATQSASALLISGVLYNPVGADTGKEWVEIYNPLNETFSGNCSLIFGNGAMPADWSVLWSGYASLAPKGYFLIGSPEGDITSTVNLQNGPDGIALECAGIRDVVGWGSHEYDEYYEGSPAVIGKEGEVLSRKLTEVGGNVVMADTGNNSDDFIYLNRSAKSSSSLGSEVTIALLVANEAPLIDGFANCTDDQDKAGYQVLPRLNDNATFSCSINASDPNGDTLSVSVELYENGSVLRSWSGNMSLFTLPLTPTDPAGEYIARVEVTDGNMTARQDIFFSYLASIGITVAPAMLRWEDLRAGKEGTLKNITLLNTGNSPMHINVQSQMPINFTIIDNGRSLLLASTLNLSSSLAAGSQLPIRLSPIIPDRTKAQAMSGSLRFSANVVSP